MKHLNREPKPNRASTFLSTLALLVSAFILAFAPVATADGDGDDAICADNDGTIIIMVLSCNGSSQAVHKAEQHTSNNIDMRSYQVCGAGSVAGGNGNDAGTTQNCT